MPRGNGVRWPFLMEAGEERCFCHGMLSDYEIHDLIVQTPESVEFAGEQCVGGAPVMLRRYLRRQDGQRGPDDEAAFLESASALCGVVGPRIVGMLEADFDAFDRLPYFITERFEGEPLPSVLGTASLSEGDARQVVAEVLEALEFLHNKGLVHGGLRADRLIWARGLGVRLAEAGVEMALIKLGDYAALGNGATTAPELHKSRSRTASGDLFALGTTAYQLLSGGPRPATIGWISVGEGSLAAWDGWLQRMCAPEPSNRPANVAEARTLLEAALAPTISVNRKAPVAPLRVAGAKPVSTLSAQASAEGRKSSLGITITGTTPVVALPSAKRRKISPTLVISVILVFAVAGGAVFLSQRGPLSVPVATAAPAPVPSVPAPVAAAEVAAAAIPELPPEPPISEVPADLVAPPVAEANVFAMEDAEKMRARIGEPGLIRGLVQRVNHPSGKYYDLLFVGDKSTAIAFMQIGAGDTDNISRKELEKFVNKTIEVRGEVGLRPWKDLRRPGIRFRSLQDITILPDGG